MAQREALEYFAPGDFEITVVNTVAECEEYFRTQVASLPTAVGLDCEWGCGVRDRPPLFPVALLQLAFPRDRKCVLVRLINTRCLTPKLEQLLKDKSVLKFGLGVNFDAEKLKEAFGISVMGCVDLKLFAPKCGHSFKRMGLRKVVQHVLYKDLDKTNQCSNWEAERLSASQVTYAACDAIVALHIIKALIKEKFGTSPSSAESVNSFFDEDEDSHIVSISNGITDVPFRSRHSTPTSSKCSVM
eukprot:Em0008g504a